MPKLLLIAMATVEVSTGVTLLAAPSFVVWLLLGEELNSLQSLVLGRMMGAALLSIGVACWRERNRKPNEGGGIFGSMLLYNLAVPAILFRAAFGDDLRGMALWPACAVHLILAIGWLRRDWHCSTKHRCDRS